MPVRRALEVACGDAPHLEALHRLGWEYVGLDRSARMLAHVRRKAAACGARVRTLRADLRDFRLRPPADFGFVLFGSVYRTSNAEFLAHLGCMARALRRGALYVLHMLPDGRIDHVARRWQGTSRRGRVTVRVTYEREIIDASRQLRRETLVLRVNDGGRRATVVERCLDKFILPQELLLLLERSAFELVGWYDGFDLRRKFDGRRAANYVVSVLRRK